MSSQVKQSRRTNSLGHPVKGRHVKNRLTPRGVSAESRPGLHLDGDGLYLQVQPSGTKSWVFRYYVERDANDRYDAHGNLKRKRERLIGLGPIHDVPLADARQDALKCRQALRQGLDPEAARVAERRRNQDKKTFDQLAAMYVDLKAASWGNAKSEAQWRSSLKTYVSPHFGHLHVDAVATHDIVGALQPIWREVPETASRIRGRIEQVLEWAIGLGMRPGPNPAGPAAAALNLGAKSVKEVTHHAALPFVQVGAFMRDLRAVGGMGARALEFAILTAARSGEVRSATWAEFDLDAAVWTVPAERMKARKEHRVPLSAAALRLLRELPKSKSPLVFPSAQGKVLSDMTLSAVTRRMEVNAVPHGFRSTFRDWCAETTNYPRDVAEMALAHTIDSNVEAAYRRGDLLEKRRALMEDWGAYCEVVATPGKVVPIREGVAA